MFGGLGPMELVVILIIALIILGPKKLPDAGRAIGKSIGEFKKALTSGSSDDEAQQQRAAATEQKPAQSDGGSTKA